jgi:hypothetical protein
MSESQLLELIDSPLASKVVARPSRAIGSPLSTDTTGSESSREEQLSGNSGINRLVTQAAPPEHNLEPIEEGLAGLQRQHLKLRAEVIMQNGSLKRVEDRLEMVRDATDRNREAIDRNAQEQQELLEDLKAFGSKVKTIAMVGITLLIVGLLLESTMYFHLKSVLP